MSKTLISHSIQIMQKLPPSDLKKNISAMTNILYDNDSLLNEFLQKVEQPLECSEDEYGIFLKSEFNRDGNSFRSPISNQYSPDINNGILPCEELRELEIKFNKMFLTYTKLYYSETAISSVYLVNLSSDIRDGFIVSILIKNSIIKNKFSNGCWDSINVVNVQFNPNLNDINRISVTYKLTCTIILQMKFRHSYCGDVDLSGSITRSTEESNLVSCFTDQQAHIENIGKLVEEFEYNLRNSIEEIYIKKTQEILDRARRSPNLGNHSLEQSNIIKEIVIDYNLK